MSAFLDQGHQSRHFGLTYPTSTPILVGVAGTGAPCGSASMPCGNLDLQDGVSSSSNCRHRDLNGPSWSHWQMF